MYTLPTVISRYLQDVGGAVIQLAKPKADCAYGRRDSQSRQDVARVLDKLVQLCVAAPSFVLLHEERFQMS